jgi:hypothetical protein
MAPAAGVFRLLDTAAKGRASSRDGNHSGFGTGGTIRLISVLRR